MSGSIIALTIPKWGLTMTEGTLTKWHVTEGSSVSEGQLLADIETSKIVNELEARDAGTIRRLVLAEGGTLPVGGLIGVMAGPEIGDAEIEGFIASFDGESAPAVQPVEAAPTPAAAEAPASASAAPQAVTQAVTQEIPASLKATDSTDNQTVLATPQARKLADRLGVNLGKVTGSGRRNRISKADLLAALGPGFANGAHLAEAAGMPQPTTPLAARLAAQLGVDLAHVALPPGQRRLRSADIVAAATVQAPRSPAAKAQAPLPSAQLVANDGEVFEDVAFEGMRATIAARLTASKASAPHYRVAMQIATDALTALRAQLNADDTQSKVSLNDLIIKACASALIASPEINIQFDGNTIRRFSDAHISVAVALDNGLVTPVIRNANRKGVREISREMAEFASRAREGSLSRRDYEGGSFSISNLGMFGVSHFDAIINPPQAAILAVGGLRRELRETEEGERAVNVIEMTLSSDHRVIDGATAARFLQKLKRYIEQPLSMLA